MTKISIYLVVLAFVYCVEAQPNPFGLDPYAMRASILQQVRGQMRSMMDPNNLKNQAQDGSMAAASARIINGKSEFKGFIASKNNGEYSEQRFSGP